MAWITGIRPRPDSHPLPRQILELQPDGLLKINPLLNWTKVDVENYIKNTTCRPIRCWPKDTAASAVRLALWRSA